MLYQQNTEGVEQALGYSLPLTTVRRLTQMAFCGARCTLAHHIWTQLAPYLGSRVL